LAQFLQQLYDETGKRVRLAIEPEPFCLLETTDEAVSFFHRLRSAAADANAVEPVREFLGLCYDICHQAVEFEDVTASIASLRENDIRINKVHITCALELRDPAANRAGREALARYVEPRYLHQTMARQLYVISDSLVQDAADSRQAGSLTYGYWQVGSGPGNGLQTEGRPYGRIFRLPDLTVANCFEPPGSPLMKCESWRIHFHVPVDAEQLGPLGTTRADLKRALQTVAGLDYAPHLEVETYTWEVLPDAKRVDLVDGLTRELVATRALLDSLSD
jgi:hypothetical protein